ncbi:hypothetical protein, variant [Aphanomyces astaci]|uniref:Uncharacterized protein n=1 Tax=Aphanomyces astaci TaxID=112090 RepID=W4GWY2_APHAT|nr:hypothetical protein H257_04150 [Aphanomyces astaci]XP_009826853.1 hypothetical protein, variant [Aphanomyces astaci]ETV83422.1 hypothetical protein H257_04150 [Aphanomyces astaci]ETV83423.1 hypothetical protein, variant [Aphanomyces astaci]|eukprot:XP_009826852.1 hypothetical protein H257_04150 [Aphanomyces astaci]
MGPPKTDNLAKNLLSRRTERQRFDSADWAMTLPMNSAVKKEVLHTSPGADSHRAAVPLKDYDAASSTSFASLKISPHLPKPTTCSPSPVVQP